MQFNLKLPESTDQTPPPENEVPDPPVNSNGIDRDPYRRACEFEPGYNWRTDPHYSEDVIRERMKAAKVEKQPVNVNDKREHPNAENKSTENNW